MHGDAAYRHVDAGLLSFILLVSFAATIGVLNKLISMANVYDVSLFVLALAFCSLKHADLG